MGLADLWMTTPGQLAGKSISQIIAFAGKLREASPASVELRHYLTLIPSTILCSYAVSCLNDKFDDSGLALQDIVNEAGRRLGFEVNNGRYRGSAGAANGHDGLWRSPTGHAVVVEVKTTDAYRIDLDTIAAYRRTLIKDQAIPEEKSSILIVVGRNDTGGLEAQVRGSRHAWDIRLISVGALFQLAHLRETLDHPHVLRQISEVLIPHEFTKVDSLIDIIFFAAEEAQSILPDEDMQSNEQESTTVATSIDDSRYLQSIQSRLRTPLVKRTRSFYSSPDNKLGVICATSKVYERNGREGFWFAFHPHQQEHLSSVSEGYVAYVCGDASTVILIPYEKFSMWLNTFWTTERNGRVYWHIRIHNIDGKMLLDRRKGLERLDISQYRI